MAKKFDARAKAKRQKIVAIGLGVVLLAVLAYEVPSLMKTMNKKPPASSAASSGPPAGALITPPTSGTPVAAPATSSSTLSDSDPAAQAGSGQLLSFDRFSSKDPFVQQATAPKASHAPARHPAAVVQPPPPPATPFKPATKPTSAQISVNGETEKVGVSATFPASDPVFRLISLTKTTAKIGIAGGSLSTGAGAVTLRKGKKVTLMNTADGTRYELVLISTS